MQVLAESPASNLTDSAWDTVKERTKMTWLEVNKLAEQYIKMCRDAHVDWQQGDFRTLLDSSLNYYENLSTIEEHIHTVAGYTDAELAEIAAAQAELEQQPTVDELQAEVTHLKDKLKDSKEKLIDANNKIRDLENQQPEPPKPVEQPQPKPQSIPQPDAPKPAEPTPAYDAINAPYTDAELYEIQEYLQSRATQKPKHTQPDAAARIANVTVKTAKFLWKVIY